MTHICVSKQTIIGSDNGLSPGRRQAIIWTNAGILLIGTLGKNFSEILIEIRIFSFKKMGLKVSSAKWHPFCLGLNVLINSMKYTLILLMLYCVMVTSSIPLNLCDTFAHILQGCFILLADHRQFMCWFYLSFWEVGAVEVGGWGWGWDGQGDKLVLICILIDRDLSNNLGSER